MRAANVHVLVRTCQSAKDDSLCCGSALNPRCRLDTHVLVRTLRPSRTVAELQRHRIQYLGGDVMTIRKPVVSKTAWVIASIASTSALGQTPPVASSEPVEVDEIIVTGSRIAREDFSSTSPIDRKSTRLNSSHSQISYAVFCLKK